VPNPIPTPGVVTILKRRGAQHLGVDELIELGVSVRKLIVVATSVVVAFGGLAEAISLLVHTLR
jgi:hypothetical protein